MNSQTDQQLLRDYTGRRSEAAFAELVRRHIDFVHSAALRMVRDAQLAEDVTQSVFVALAQNARQLTDHAVLSGWLHRTTQNLAANAVRADVRRRAREQEAAAMNELFSAEPDALWEHIAPQLDEALGELNEGDRDALLLRYFERKSAREMAQTLGTSEDAAQKRVSRAVERLREFFAKRGITVGASGLVVVITANAVQAAPVGLAATILTSATLVGTTIATTVTATKAIVMTTLQKTVIIAIVVASVVTPLVLKHQTQAKLRDQDEALRMRVDQLAGLQLENEHLSNLLAQSKSSRSLSPDQFNALMRLRNQVGSLGRDVKELTQLTAAGPTSGSNSIASSEQLWSGRVNELKRWLDSNASEKIPELQFLDDRDWLDGVYPHKLESEEEYRQAMRILRANAEQIPMEALHRALGQYSKENGGQFPTDLSQLKPFLKPPIDDAILERYEIVPTSSLIPELQPGGDWAITQKSPVNEALDLRFAFGLTNMLTADERITNRWSRAH